MADATDQISSVMDAAYKDAQRAHNEWLRRVTDTMVALHRKQAALDIANVRTFYCSDEDRRNV